METLHDELDETEAETETDTETESDVLSVLDANSETLDVVVTLMDVEPDRDTDNSSEDVTDTVADAVGEGVGTGVRVFVIGIVRDFVGTRVFVKEMDAEGLKDGSCVSEAE